MFVGEGPKFRIEVEFLRDMKIPFRNWHRHSKKRGPVKDGQDPSSALL
jgi:hypothetical protein